MAKVAGASLLREIHVPDETWMSCMVHCLNNLMKNVITNHCRTEILQVVLHDFRSMKKIIEDANRAGWNHFLPEGFRLFQESETRFGTHYQVAERFLKAAPKIYSPLDSHLGPSARASYSSLKKISNIDGTITGYPGIEAVFDAFGIVVDCTERFEVSKRPIIHIALPFIFQMMRKIKTLPMVYKYGEVKDTRWLILQFIRGL